MDHLRRTIRQLGLLQIDYVNVLVPAHYLVLDALAAELRTMAAWLDLDSVAVGRRGGFARLLAAAARPEPLGPLPRARGKLRRRGRAEPPWLHGRGGGDQTMVPYGGPVIY